MPRNLVFIQHCTSCSLDTTPMARAFHDDCSVFFFCIQKDRLNLPPALGFDLDGERRTKRRLKGDELCTELLGGNDLS